MRIVCIKQKRYIQNIVLIICALASLHGVTGTANRGRISMTAGVSQAICISTAKYSKSNTIQGPQKDASKFHASNKAKCDILQWNKCESRGSCRTFECPLGKGTRIVGGTDALPHEFPYQIQIKKNKPTCGAALLNKRFIISAAHCFRDKDKSIYTVVAGVHNKIKYDGMEQERKIKTITVHENYNSTGKENDISLIQVDPPFDLTAAVQPILMPEPNHEAIGDATVTGWGRLTDGGDRPDILQKVTVPIIMNKECSDAYERVLPSTMICAGFLGVGGKDACSGDSGSPLVVKMANGSYLLVGVVSWGFGCAEAEHPGVYTRVAKFLDWIYKNADVN